MLDTNRYDCSGKYVKLEDLIVIPDRNVRKLLSNIHARYHCGRSGMKKLLNRYGIHIRKLESLMEEVVRKCEACQKTKPGRAVKMGRLPLPEPTEILCLDHFEWKKNSFLVMIDLGSRYC